MNNLFPPEHRDKRQAAEIPDMLRPLSAVVIARLSPAGKLLDFNRGFSRLVGEAYAVKGSNVTAFFINPNIVDLIDQVQEAQHGILFEGILTMGDPQSQCQSMRGAIWLDAGGLLLVAEYDIDHMELLAASVLELNNELSDVQRQLTRQNVELKRSHDKIRHLSLTDTLTDIPNRRAFNERLHGELEHGIRSGQAFALIVCDIDHFKHVNDTFGHDVGDVVLQTIAASLSQCIRPYDFIARIGGEEFIVILPDADRSTMLTIAERLRSTIAARVIPEIGHVVTISLGATLWQSGDTAHSIFHRADKAVYAAKEGGRNCVREA
jgi:diguanylate cyclase (GGDEF)-like protein